MVWMRRVRNLSIALLFLTVFSFHESKVRAEAFECDTIYPIELNVECIAGPMNACFNMFTGFENGWCALHESQTCEEFCGTGNVVDSECWYEDYLFYAGQHIACSNEAYIWCQCSES